MFSINDIHIARTVSKAGSIHAAAQRLHKSQPAISQTLKRLEQKVGFSLFDRSGYRVALTAKGEDFLLQAEALVAHDIRLTEYAEMLRKGQESTVNIAVWPMVEDQIVMPALADIHSRYPETHLNVDLFESTRALDKLIIGEAELALSPYRLTQHQEEAIDTAVIDQVSLVCVIAPALLQQHNPAAIVREQLTQWNLLVLRDPISGKSNSFGAERGGRRWAVNDQRIMHKLILQGLGWGLMPEPAIRDGLASGELIEINLPDFGNRMEVDVIVGRLRNKPLGPIASACWDAFLQHAKVS